MAPRTPAAPPRSNPTPPAASSTPAPAADLVPYPAPVHLAWLAKSRPRDKVLPEGTARAVLARPVIVEEKPDGALIGIAFPDGESARVQHRNAILTHPGHAQFQPLWGWLATYQDALARRLGKGHVLFGEWCFATHTEPHDQLPDWFLAVDVLELATGRYWTVDRRNTLARDLGIATAPEILRNKVDLATLKTRLAETPSALGSGSAAGFVVRLESGDHLVERALLMRADLAEAPADPATHKTLARNALA